MKKILILLFFITTTTTIFAQIKFEKGYFIENNGERTECLIYNQDWRLNPEAFDYKLMENGKVTSAKITEIKEFGVYDFSKYIRATVGVDVSSNTLNELTYNKDPLFENRTVFLKSITEGKATLYIYQDINVQRFFYSINANSPKPLVYKRYYKALHDKTIIYNLEYKQELLINLNCIGLQKAMFEKLEYKKRNLEKLFIEYNKCNGTYIEPVNEPTKAVVYMGLKVGYANQSFDYKIGQVNKSVFNSNYRIGLEGEFILPFNKNKWSVFVAPTFQKINAFNEVSTLGIDYTSIECPIGIRHYFFLNDNSKIFVNAAFVLDYNLPSTYTYDGFTYEINSAFNVLTGIGYKYKDKVSIEFNFATPRKLVQKLIFLDVTYQSTGVYLGYYF